MPNLEALDFQPLTIHFLHQLVIRSAQHLLLKFSVTTPDLSTQQCVSTAERRFGRISAGGEAGPWKQNV